MEKYFNVTGACYPDKHYMVDITSRLEQIKEMVAHGDYFSINRGRQYGKTTLLKALENYLKDDHTVLHLDFQGMSSDDFESEKKFVKGFARELWLKYHSVTSSDICEQLKIMKQSLENNLADLFAVLAEWCEILKDKPAVLIIDEVDYASNNQIFLDFLAQLRKNYLNRDNISTFQSVILAGVHDIQNLKQKIRPDEAHRHNSPWNITTEFKVDMSFSADDISGMLERYENDNKTGMDIPEISQFIYDCTSGYPILVSTLCKYMDEDFDFSVNGANDAFKKIIKTSAPLFESLINKLEYNTDLRRLIYHILFSGKKIAFNALNSVVKNAAMYGFIKDEDGSIAVANRIFEVIIYEWFISLEATENEMYSVGINDKNQFISEEKLDIKKILEKFILHFNEIYGNNIEKFKEEEGRKIFLLYLRPIINGIGNYYIEARTRDNKRTDIIIDYAGKQYIIELKIWRGEEYNKRGEQQIADYLDYYNTDTGYLMSFNFNKNKKTGVHTITIGDKTIVEGVV